MEKIAVKLKNRYGRYKDDHGNYLSGDDVHFLDNSERTQAAIKIDLLEKVPDAVMPEPETETVSLTKETVVDPDPKPDAKSDNKAKPETKKN